MKKVYTKPGILFDSFELAQSIAACDVINSNPTQNACGYPIMNGLATVFISATTGCSTTEADGQYDKICYHVPDENYNLFGS